MAGKDRIRSLSSCTGAMNEKESEAMIDKGEKLYSCGWALRRGLFRCSVPHRALDCPPYSGCSPAAYTSSLLYGGQLGGQALMIC
jgi:hypothetical protein